MLTLFGFVLGTAAGSVLALLVYCELLACRRQKAAIERREAELRADMERLQAEVDRLESAAEAREYCAPEGMYSTQWLSPQPEVRA